MNLEQRLRLLGGQAGGGAAAPATGGVGGGAGAIAGVPPDVPRSLAERLRRVGTAAAVTALVPSARRPDEAALATVLGAERMAPGVLRVERRRSLAEPHGEASLTGCAAALPALLDEPVGTPAGWLFLDTETSGLAGGTGTWAFLFGAARIDGDELVLRQYLLTRLDAEPAYLEAVANELAAATLLVTYNGKSFDAPLITTRMRLAGLRAGLDGPHLDLLAPVRRAFARVWPDCRLMTAEARLLGLVRRGDLSGSEAPLAWLAWLRQGETARLGGVLVHNRADLISLPALVRALAQAFRDPAAAGADVRAVAAHHAARGRRELARSLLMAQQDQLCPAGLADLARLQRAAGDRAAAREIWNLLAGQGDAAGIEALAKHLEHQERDYAGALALARRLPPGSERERRCGRLAARLAPRGGEG